MSALTPTANPSPAPIPTKSKNLHGVAFALGFGLFLIAFLAPTASAMGCTQLDKAGKSESVCAPGGGTAYCGTNGGPAQGASGSCTLFNDICIGWNPNAVGVGVGHSGGVVVYFPFVGPDDHGNTVAGTEDVGYSPIGCP